ncbi:mitochondrial fusion protein-like protein [Tricladium varicosporioides]|nr:mitochondrial fusion protein-like protein [Hymenoscyphus varicosporioides]
MATLRDGPNPLRPYYRPPSIGVPQDKLGTTSTGTHGLGPKNGSAASYASAARDMFDYNDYLADSSPSSIEAVRRTLDDWLYKYFSVLLAQPFDVAKTVLQVRSQGLIENTKPTINTSGVGLNPAGYRESVYSDYPSDDSDPDDEPAYFTSSAPLSNSYPPPRSRRRRASNRDFTPPPHQAPAASPNQIVLKRPDSVLEVISQEWNKEGAWGVWKGSNSTFLYSLLLQTVEEWSRGVFSALFNVPEAGVTPSLSIPTELVGSQYPWASLGVAVAAAVSAGLILAPLDLVRTKLILTPISLPKRSLLHHVRNLPSYLCPTTLIIPTALHSLIAPLINHSTPLLLLSHLGIDPVLTPTTYSVADFLSRTAELFIKLPLETVLRRGQAFVLKSTLYIDSNGERMEMLVEPGPYKGVLGTMWSIVREEGTSLDTGAVVKTATLRKRSERKGQGIEGLWRGWRVGMWGLVGMWGAKAMGGSGGQAGEF